MKLTVANFENVANSGKSTATRPVVGKTFVGCSLMQGRSGLGGVDGMMKKDFKAIVAAYVRRVAKDGADMKPGPVRIEIVVSEGWGSPRETVVINGVITN